MRSRSAGHPLSLDILADMTLWPDGSMSKLTHWEALNGDSCGQLADVLGPHDAGAPMTLDEFEQANFEPGCRYELINRVLLAMPPLLEEERDANKELGHCLRTYQASHPEVLRST